MEQSVEIDVRAIITVLLRKIWLLVLMAAIGGVALYIYTVSFVTPMYTASVSIYVNNSTENKTNVGITSSDISTSQRLVKTYINMIKSDTVLEKVADTSGLEITAVEIRGMLTAESIDSTEMFKVEITDTDPARAQTIANAMAEVAPDEIANFVEGSSTKIIDYAKLPQAPVSPNITKNVLLGAGCGIVLAVAVAVVQVMVDVRIKSEEDIKRISQAPVLGTIPDFAQEDSSNRYGYSYGYSTGSQKQSGDSKEAK